MEASLNRFGIAAPVVLLSALSAMFCACAQEKGKATHPSLANAAKARVEAPGCDEDAPLLANPSFESADALSGWRGVVIADYGHWPVASIDSDTHMEGRQSLVVESKDPTDFAVVQTIRLPARSLWRATCWIKTEGLKATDPAATGGTLQIRTMDNGPIAAAPGQFGTSEWRQATVTFRVPDSGEAQLVLFFVGFGKGTGKVWLDDVRLREMTSADPASADAPGSDVSPAL
jgi:hypothetical protein